LSLPLQQILSKWLFEAFADLPWAQNELLQQLENQHYPKHPSKIKKIPSEPPTPRLSVNRNKGNEALTLTIPATNAPQLNVPMSFGIEINLQPILVY
jgi:hypothetical protein